jgi:anti-anti-sigma factor
MDLSTFRASDINGVPTVSVHGEIDLANALAFRNLMLQSRRIQTPQVAIDLSQCTYLDGAGLSALMAVHDEVKHRVPLVVPEASFLRRVVSIAGLDACFCIHDRADALVRCAAHESHALSS